VDVVEHTLISLTHEPLLKCARFYGFRNIQNLVRKLKPVRGSRLPGAAASVRRKEGINRKQYGGGNDYAYVEVMACPGGCTNGGGQIKADEAIALQKTCKAADEDKRDMGDARDGIVSTQREWLKRVDSAYFSAASDSDSPGQDADFDMHDPGPDPSLGPQASSQTAVHDFLAYWSAYTSIPLDKLVYTSYRNVESDVGKSRSGSNGLGDMERVATLAGSIGGGW